jgi:hypothetical protein
MDKTQGVFNSLKAFDDPSAEVANSSFSIIFKDIYMPAYQAINEEQK